MDDRERIRHIAALARLRSADEDLDLATEQFGRILAMFAKLDELDMSDVKPTHGVSTTHDVLRKDEPRPSLPRSETLANGTDVDAACFRVAKVLDDTTPGSPSESGS